MVSREYVDTIEGKGLCKMKWIPGALIQCSGTTNRTIEDLRKNYRNTLFTAELLTHICKENMCAIEIFQEMVNNVYKKSDNQQKALCLNGCPAGWKIFLNEVIDGRCQIKAYLSCFFGLVNNSRKCVEIFCLSRVAVRFDGFLKL